MKNYKGKTALITGASRGVGFALARQLAERGASVVITARGKKRLDQSLAELKNSGANAVAVTGDVGKYSDAQKMVAAAVDNFGRLDIVVNNAGVSMRGNFAELTPEVCKNVVDRGTSEAETLLPGIREKSRS